MKVFFKALLAIIALIIIAFKIFVSYNSDNVLYNEASFEIFLDSKTFDPESYFNLPEGTYDPEKHIVVCKLPVNPEPARPGFIKVRTDLENLDCNSKAEIQYQPYELNGPVFEIMLVNKFTNLYTLGLPISKGRILARKSIVYGYHKGEINRLLVSENGFIPYCR